MRPREVEGAASRTVLGVRVCVAFVRGDGARAREVATEIKATKQCLFAAHVAYAMRAPTAGLVREFLHSRGADLHAVSLKGLR